MGTRWGVDDAIAHESGLYIDKQSCARRVGVPHGWQNVVSALQVLQAQAQAGAPAGRRGGVEARRFAAVFASEERAGPSRTSLLARMQGLRPCIYRKKARKSHMDYPSGPLPGCRWFIITSEVTEIDLG